MVDVVNRARVEVPRSPMNRWAWIGAVVAGAIVIAVVGFFLLGGAASDSGAAPDSGAAVRPGGPNGSTATAQPRAPIVSAADAEFVAGMIPHHEQALVLVDLLEGRVSEGDALDLARRMRAAQTGELEVLTAWADSHADMMPSHGHTHAMGMATQSELDEFASLTGAEAEHMFLEIMIRHHRGAVDMAATRLKVSGDGAITDYARNVFAEQSAEIARMQELLDQ